MICISLVPSGVAVTVFPKVCGSPTEKFIGNCNDNDRKGKINIKLTRMQVSLDYFISASAAFAPSNLECSKADALFFEAGSITSCFWGFFVASVLLRLRVVDWSFVKLLNFRIVSAEDERNTEIMEEVRNGNE
jgi:hypothetical protein